MGKYLELTNNAGYHSPGVQREVVFKDMTFYVDTVNGNDGNDGLSATSAFKTPQGVADELRMYDGNGYNCTIQFADGTYTTAVEFKWVYGWNYLYLKGDETTPSNVTWTVTGENTNVVTFPVSCHVYLLYVSGIRFEGPAARSNNAFRNYVANSTLYLNNPDSGGYLEFHNLRFIAFSQNRSTVMSVGGHWKCSGTFGGWLAALDHGFVGIYPDDLTVEGDINCTMGVFNAYLGGRYDIWPANAPDFTTASNSGKYLVLNGPSTGWDNDLGYTELGMGDASKYTIPTWANLVDLDTLGGIAISTRTVANIGDATLRTGAVVFVTDEAGGATLAYSDGTNWRRVQDRTIVS